jgi:hypothetical protein
MRTCYGHAGTYLDEIHLRKCVVASGLLDIKNGDDIFMVEVPQQLHLAQSSQAEHGVIEWSNLLDRNLLSAGFVKRRAIQRVALVCGATHIEFTAIAPSIVGIDVPNYTVCTLSHHILNIILLGHVERDLARTRGIRRARHLVVSKGLGTSTR